MSLRFAAALYHACIRELFTPLDVLSHDLSRVQVLGLVSFLGLRSCLCCSKIDQVQIILLCPRAFLAGERILAVLEVHAPPLFSRRVRYVCDRSRCLLLALLLMPLLAAAYLLLMRSARGG